MILSFFPKLLNRKIFLNKAHLPFKIILAVTYGCNSRCRNCNIWQIYQKSPERKSAEMSLAEFEKLFKEVKNSLLFLELTGGEPFLREDIGEIIMSASKNLSKDCFITITTNGFSTERILSKIETILPKIKQNFVMAVSLDGKKEIHQKTRRIDNGYDKTIKTFLGLKKLTKIYKNFYVHLSYSIFPENSGMLEEFLNFIEKEYGIKPSEVSTSFCQESSLYHLNKKINRNNRFKINALRDITYFQKISKKEKNPNIFLNQKNKFKIFYLEKIPQFISDPKKMIIPCTALRASTFIDPYGDVYPCIEWGKKIGSLKNQSLKEIWKSPQAQNLRKKICNKECPNCWTVCEAQPSYLMNWPKN